MKKDSNYNRGRSYCMQKTTDYPQKTYVGNEDQRSWNTRIYYQYHLDTALPCVQSVFLYSVHDKELNVLPSKMTTLCARLDNLLLYRHYSCDQHWCGRQECDRNCTEVQSGYDRLRSYDEQTDQNKLYDVPHNSANVEGLAKVDI